MLALAYSRTKLRSMRLLLDTGASTTTFRPEFADELQLSHDDRLPEAEMVAMTGIITADLYILPRLRALGHVVENLSIASIEIPIESGVDGVLGFDFLKRFRIAFNAARGVIVVQSLEPVGLVTRLRDMLEWVRIA